MGQQLVDIYGNPLSSKTLTVQQSDTAAFIRRQYAEHPALGMDINRLYRIFAEAEQGHLTRQADFFFDMEERDGHVFAELSKRRRAVMPLAWTIKPPRNATAQEKAMAAAATEWFQDLPEFEALMFDMLDAIGHGFSPIELEWERAEGVWLPKAFHKRPQRWFQTPPFDGDDIRLIDGSLDGAPLRPFGWILHRHRAKSGWLAESGLFRVLAWTYLFKNISVRDLAEFLEIYGLPMRVGKYPAGTTEDQKDALWEAVTDLGHNAGGIIPADMAIEIQSAAQGQVDPFKFMMEWCERTQSKVILGGTLTSQADGQSSTNALGNIHNEVRHDLRASDAVQLAGTLTRELLYPLLVLNGYSGITPRRMCRFEFDTRQQEDTKDMAEAIFALVKANMKVPERWAQEKTGVPAPVGDEPVLAPIAPNASVSALSALQGIQPVVLPALPAPTLPPPTLAALSAPTAASPDQVAQDTLDAAPEAFAGLVNTAMADLLAPVLAALQQGRTPDEARDIIASAYPQLNDAALRQLIAQAVFVSDLWGRVNAGD
ncbi:DUF935 domain-containing protein [Serratia marcescens]|uniref:DUF935 domain-containing protein n=1 Tax=Serratia marcescens TaxID=615 RepID=A0A5C7BSC7_SERMA|nr:MULTISPECIES: DUF935 domain-containing protein [Serratia]TXE27143.1 DUF935 domain-containing protein [Serratia marcescens]TXE55300.1 DUF935 domain-containing protein [Serratia marcescens]